MRRARVGECTLSVPDFFPNPVPVNPPPGVRAVTVVIDAEEEFDWGSPLHDSPFTTHSLRNIGDLQAIFHAYGIVPAYLLTFPILQDPATVSVLRRYHARGECILGLQLHAWVTPPFGEGIGFAQSYTNNLDDALQEAKLCSMMAAFDACFGCRPRIYRAGRYGAGAQTAALLEKHGFEIDTSVAPCSSFRADGGPDYSATDYGLFWFGRQRRLLEVPLCRSIVGWGGALGSRSLQHFTATDEPRIRSALSRFRIAERITLSPEGNDLGAMMRLVRYMAASGRTLLPISFHSSSLVAGGNPYVRSRADLHWFYDRLSGLLDHLTGQAGFTAGSLAQFPALLNDGRAGGDIHVQA